MLCQEPHFRYQVKRKRRGKECRRLGDIIIIIISLTSSYIIYGKNTDYWSVCHPIIFILFMYLASIKRTKQNHNNKSVQITQTSEKTSVSSLPVLIRII